MRLRNVKGSVQRILDSPYVIYEPYQYKGEWKRFFQNDNPIVIEIGMGKGKFLRELAVNFPAINYIGIEKFSSVLVRALEKREELEINNLFFLRIDAKEIENIFGEEEISKIYLNFSDPWPKEKHTKRRLTAPAFLEQYKKILKKDGSLILKTDNKDLFSFSIEQIREAGWEIPILIYDLHNKNIDVKIIEQDFLTEYEERFIKEKVPICFLTAYHQKT